MSEIKGLGKNVDWFGEVVWVGERRRPRSSDSNINSEVPDFDHPGVVLTKRRRVKQGTSSYREEKSKGFFSVS